MVHPTLILFHIYELFCSFMKFEMVGQVYIKEEQFNSTLG